MRFSPCGAPFARAQSPRRYDVIRTSHWLGFAVLLSIASLPSAAASVSIADRGGFATIEWRGDEAIDVRVSKAAGVLGSPITVRVDDREIVLGGYYAAFNGKGNGLGALGVNTQVVGSRLIIEHRVRCEGLSEAVPLRFALWMVPTDKCLRVKVSYPEGPFHLDRLGLLPHEGNGLEAQRIFLGRMLVMNAPFQPFDLKHDYNMTRYWCFTMANGLTEMQATDRVPRGFKYDPRAGVYDEYTYCDSPIVYTFVFTGKGPQEAIAHYRSSLRIPAPSSIGKLPGRNLIMAAHPIAERYEDFLDELTSRGVRDFIWLSYSPAIGDRERVERYGGLYAIYDMYTDLFDYGVRRSKGWSPKQVIYTRPGRMMRGYWHATRLLPELYVKFATTRVMATLGREMANRGFMRTQATRYSNLAVSKRELHPAALYFDVHSSKTPFHYYDYRGVHHPARAYLAGEKALFDFARAYLGNVPILSEGDGEAFAGIMDGGIFMDWPTPATLGIKCGDWDYYPNLDQVHRGRMLSVGFHLPLMDPDPEELSLSMLFGRLHSINAYWGSRQENPAARAAIYYATSAFHRMLGLSRIERIDFVDNDIHRAVVHYSNGTTAWSNRSASDWEVKGYRLPPKGYLMTGPGGFCQVRCIRAGKPAVSVECKAYRYYASSVPTDFGPVELDGSVALKRSGNRIVIHELKRPRGEIRVNLARVAPDLRGARLERAYFRLTRGRKVPLRVPDVMQEGPIVRFSPPEMTTVTGYELILAPGRSRK